MKSDKRYIKPTNLYDLIKGHFVMQGTTVTEWCTRNGVKLQNLKSAITGGWKGPKATALVNKAIEDSGLVLEEVA